MKQGQLLRRLGLRHPIIQGPFGGGFSSVKLLIAVSDAGGLGSFGAHQLSPAEIEALGSEIRSITQAPFGLNLWVDDDDLPEGGLPQEEFAAYAQQFAPWFAQLGITLPTPPGTDAFGYEQQVEAMLRMRPAVFSFVFGIPSPAILEECRKQGIVTLGAATTLDEALANEEAGVDVVLATGFEAGGHRPSFLRRSEESLTGTLALVRQVVKHVKIPVVAAGGIADGAGVAAALRLGAEAVQVGTAFLACEESNATPEHRRWLFSPAARNTTLTRAGTGRLARFMRSYLIDAMENAPIKPLPYPAQGWFTAPVRKAAAQQDNADLVAYYAGQGAPLLKHHHVKDLFAELLSELHPRS